MAGLASGLGCGCPGPLLSPSSASLTVPHVHRRVPSCAGLEGSLHSPLPSVPPTPCLPGRLSWFFARAMGFSPSVGLCLATPCPRWGLSQGKAANFGENRGENTRIPLLLCLQYGRPPQSAQVPSSGFLYSGGTGAVRFCSRGWESRTEMALPFPLCPLVYRGPFFCPFDQNDGFSSEFLLFMPTVIIPKFSQSVSQCQQLKDTLPTKKPQTKKNYKSRASLAMLVFLRILISFPSLTCCCVSVFRQLLREFCEFSLVVCGREERPSWVYSIWGSN